MSHERDPSSAVPRDRICLLRPEQLHPTEHIIEVRVHEVLREIVTAGIWQYPVFVERRTEIIMDGHHRRECALRLGFSWIPCLMLDYSQVVLESWIPGFELTPDDVISRGLQHRPYPAKTTRHTLLTVEQIHCDIAFSVLRRSDNAMLRSGSDPS